MSGFNNETYAPAWYNDNSFICIVSHPGGGVARGGVRYYLPSLANMTERQIVQLLPQFYIPGIRPAYWTNGMQLLPAVDFKAAYLTLKGKDGEFILFRWPLNSTYGTPANPGDSRQEKKFSLCDVNWEESFIEFGRDTITPTPFVIPFVLNYV